MSRARRPSSAMQALRRAISLTLPFARPAAASPRSTSLRNAATSVTEPQGWPVITISDLYGIELRNGISPSRAGTIVGDVLTLSAVTRDVFDGSAQKESMFAAPLSPDQCVSRSSFLICRGNGNPTLVGRAAFPDQEMPNVAFPDTMIALRTTDTRLAPTYLSAVWASDHLRAQIKAAAKTTNGTFKISQGSIRRFSFPLPPPDIQLAFAERVQRVEGVDRQLEAAASKADAILAALSAQVFGFGPPNTAAADAVGEAEAVDLAAAD
jgi:type I restriction enzyme S subunit